MSAPEGTEGTDAGRFDRRRFLQYGATSIAGLLAAGHWRVLPAAAQQGQGPQRRTRGPSLTAVLRRREDQLRLDVEFYNLKLDTQGPRPVLVRQRKNDDAHVVVVFPPQHVMEQAGYEYDAALQDDFQDPQNPDPVGPQPPPPPPPVGARLAGSTRLAFLVPGDRESIPFDVDGLLEWEEWIPSLVPVALRSLASWVGEIQPTEDPPELRAPGALHTAIEMPWWLVLSPHVETGWRHTTKPVTRAGRTELWHTRLGGRAPGGDVDEDDEARMTVRAVWTRDPDFPAYLDDPGDVDLKPPDGEEFGGQPVGMPFRTPLSPRDRYDLVTSTSDIARKVSKSHYLPEPAHVNRMMLTPLGGWLDLHGAWRAGAGAGESGTSLEAWRHRATMGRDHYVRIVRAGCLFPLGFAASLVKVTERKFRTQDGRRVAYLFQGYFLVVRQRQVTYGGAGHDNQGRGFPFTRLRTRTLITPNLDPPGGHADDPQLAGWNKTEAFVPRVGGAPFRFHLVGTDLVGRSIDLHTPVVFVDGLRCGGVGDMTVLRTVYYDALDADAPERSIRLDGASVAVAEVEEGQPPGATDLEIQRLSLGAEAPVGSAQDRTFFPTMAEAEVRLAAAEAILGGPASTRPVVEFDKDYLADGFDTAGEVFVRLVAGAAPAVVSFGGSSAGDRSGGVVTPNIGVTALSRTAGTVGGDVDTFQGGQFKPEDYFPLDATLLGNIRLRDVVQVVGGQGFDPSDPRVVQLSTREEDHGSVTELRWSPELQNVGYPTGGDLFVAAYHGPATLSIHATITTPKGAPQASTFVVVGDLRRFQVVLLNDSAKFLVVAFNRLRFQSETGKKTDVDVEIAAVEFARALEFVNKLKDYLSFSAGGFEIALLPTHLDAGFALPIPNISIGVFSLSNIAFTAGAVIPFTGQPVRFRFGFSTRENPFLLSVMIFSGGGFFELSIGPDGVEAFQAALEFGVSAAMDFGIASGSVKLVAGIYLAIGIETQVNPDGKLELTGYLVIEGRVRVIGIITVTIRMEAAFTYVPDTKKALVRATVVVEVKVGFIGGSQEIEFERKFGGSADPTFGETLTEAEWHAYADAFAPIGA